MLQVSGTMKVSKIRNLLGCHDEFCGEHNNLCNFLTKASNHYSDKKRNLIGTVFG